VYTYKVTGQVELLAVDRLDFETESNKIAFSQALATSADVSYNDVFVIGSFKKRRLADGENTAVFFEVKARTMVLARQIKTKMATSAFVGSFAEKLVRAGVIASKSNLVMSADDLAVEEISWTPDSSSATGVFNVDSTLEVANADEGGIMNVVYAGLGGVISILLLMCVCWCRKQSEKSAVAPHNFKGKGKHKVSGEDSDEEDNYADLVPVARPVSRESAMPMAEVHMPRRGPPLSDAMANLPAVFTKNNAVAPGLTKMSAVRIGDPVEEPTKKSSMELRQELGERAPWVVKPFSGEQLANLPTRPDDEDNYVQEQRLSNKVAATLPPRPPAHASPNKSKKYLARRDSERSIDLEAGEMSDVEPNSPLTPSAVGLRQLSIRDTDCAELVDEIVSDGSYDSASEYSDEDESSGASASELSSDEEDDEEFFDRRGQPMVPEAVSNLKIKGKGPSFSHLMMKDGGALKPIPMRKVREEDEEEKVEEEDE